MNNFRSARKKVRMTQEEVANRLGITRAAYTHYENGDRECPFDSLLKLSDIFNVSADYLLGRENLKSRSIPQEETNLLEGFRSLTTEGKNTLLTVLKGLQLVSSHSATA